MPNEELKQLLEQRATPELTNVISSLDAALAAAGFTMHRDELDHLMGIESQVDSSTIIDDVVDILRIAADKTLATMEVEVSDQIPLDRLVDLINYLIGFAVSDDSQHIYDMIENREDNESLLCDIMEVVSEHDSGGYLPYITVVGKNLVEKMRSVIVAGFDSEETPLQDVTDTTARLATWSGDKPVVAELLDEQSVPVGTSMESLISIYGDVLADMPAKEAMDNLVYLTMYSDVSNEALVDEVEFRIEGLFTSLEDNQQGYVHFRKHKPALESLVGDPDA